MWTWSVDLAHHYALAFRISEQWILTSSSDPTIGEMNFYPRGSHIIAAIVGVVVNSTFLGIQITTLLSLALLWMSILLILNNLPVGLAVKSIICLVGLVILNAASTEFNLHGHEIVGNFFYSQLVGYSVLFLSIWSAICVEKKHGSLPAIIFLTALMLLNAWIHLLPALEMLGLVCGLLFAYIFFEGESIPKLKSYKFLTVLFIGLIAILGITLHPSFSAMRLISKNNGSMALHHIIYPTGLIFLALLVLFTSFKCFSDNKENNVAIKYLSIYGGAAAGLCLLQFVLIWFGQGSDYAVKKYGFGLTTNLCINLSIISAGYIDRLLTTRRIGFSIVSNQIIGYILPAALIIIFVFSVPSQKKLDVSDVVAFERKLLSLSDTILPVPGNGKNNVVIGLDNMPAAINYMFSIAIAKTIRTIAIPDILVNNNISNPSDYSYIISSFKNPSFGAFSCNSLSSGALSIVSSACIEQRIAKEMDCRATFDFSSNGGMPKNILEGFSSPEAHGRWTDGKIAKFHCLNKGIPLKALKLQIRPFVFGALRSQRLSVAVNDHVLGKFDLSVPHGPENPLVINIPPNLASGKVLVEFEIPDATSPREVGLSEDGRKLGFSFQSIIFD